MGKLLRNFVSEGWLAFLIAFVVAALLGAWSGTHPMPPP